MPEGDSVYRTAAQLRQALAGRLLTAADLRVPAHNVPRIGSDRLQQRLRQ